VWYPASDIDENRHVSQNGAGPPGDLLVRITPAEVIRADIGRRP
jgi:hypothetical protein